MYDFRLEDLVHFNQAAVYEFIPEQILAAQSGSTALKNARLPNAAQFKDMLDTYLYAERTILPFILNDVTKVTPALFLEWIMHINQTLGRTLSRENASGSRAGEFVKEITTRYKPGYEGLVMNEVAYYIQKYPGYETPTKAASKMAKLGVDYTDSFNFLKLLNKVNLNFKDAIIPKAQLVFEIKFTNAPKFFRAMSKLAIVYHSEQINKAERDIVGKVVKLGCLGTQIKPKMEAFAKEIFEKLAELNSEDITEVATFLSKIFQQLYNIHPFENANKRTSICLLNIFLCALQLPSIVLYDSLDDHSAYRAALMVIEENPAALAAVIQRKIEEAMVKPFENLSHRQYVVSMVEGAAIIDSIRTQFPKLDMDTEFDKLTSEYVAEMAKIYGSKAVFYKVLADQGTDKNAHFESWLVTKLKIFQQGMRNKVSSQALTMNPTMVESTSIMNSIDALLIKLNELTGLDEWKKNVKADPKVWHLFGSLQKAENFSTYLKSTHAMDVTLSQPKDNPEIWIVMCQNIAIKTLMEHSVPFSLDECKMRQVPNLGAIDI